jgi:thiamine kinase-like enzyme
LTAKVEAKIFDAYDSIHRLGVAHNDVRAENVLIAQPEGSVWIIDFEHAGRVDDVVANVERENVKDMLREVRMQRNKRP